MSRRRKPAGPTPPGAKPDRAAAPPPPGPAAPQALKPPEVTPMTPPATATPAPPAAAPARRLGDTGKCPACGSEVDPGAYHCPRCRNYFCYRCRARVVKDDAQFQCFNQGCDFHGKLVCAACDPGSRREEPPVVYPEHEDGWWPSLVPLGLAAGVVALFYLPFLQSL